MRDGTLQAWLTDHRFSRPRRPPLDSQACLCFFLGFRRSKAITVRCVLCRAPEKVGQPNFLVIVRLDRKCLGQETSGWKDVDPRRFRSRLAAIHSGCSVPLYEVLAVSALVSYLSGVQGASRPRAGLSPPDRRFATKYKVPTNLPLARC